MHAVKFFNNALSGAMIVNKNERLPGNVCLEEILFAIRFKHTGIISSDKRLIKLADTEKIPCSRIVDGIHLYYRVAVEHSMAFYISSVVFYYSTTKSPFLFT